MTKRASTLRWTVRGVFVVLAVLLALGGPLPAWSARAYPSLSPLAALSAALARRAWYAALFWLAPPAAVLLLAVWRGRFFCRWVCPAGTLYALPIRMHRNRVLMRTRLNGYVFWVLLAASVTGVPALLFLDPLAGFNRLIPLLRGAASAAALIPGLLVPAFLVAGLFQPQLWCTHVCPLGYFFDLVHRRAGSVPRTVDRYRREIALGILAGLPLALLASRFPRLRARAPRLPVLPPGANDPASFAALCSRCYACVNTCPSGVLRPRISAGQTLAQFCQPEMDPQSGVCDEYCNRCSQVCATGALQPLTEDQKRYRRIGTARINREACLAWTDKQHCMVCDEYCPYNAIDTIMSPEGIPQPQVVEERCRGCGMCQHHCPAIRAGKAIIVHGIERQGPIPPDEFYSI